MRMIFVYCYYSEENEMKWSSCLQTSKTVICIKFWYRRGNCTYTHK